MNEDLKTMDYDDIIHLPHPVSKRHPQMSLANRAAQFAPFAALTGHREAIDAPAPRHQQELDDLYDTSEYYDPDEFYGTDEFHDS